MPLISRDYPKKKHSRAKKMGIRIHKVMGYGLTDLKCDQYKIVDERINPDGILGNPENEEDYTREGFIDYLKSLHPGVKDFSENGEMTSLDFSKQSVIHASLEYHQLTSKKNWEPIYSIIYSAEFGLSNVLFIIPPCEYENWRRYDDPIDYMESLIRSRQGESEINYFTLTNCGIFPYDFAMDNRTGEMLKDQCAEAYYLRRRVLECDNVLNQNEKDVVLKHLATSMGFASVEECDKHLAPFVPYNVRFLERYTKLFRDPSIVFSLRPMLYVYWS
jgi:hypothetical protein